MKATPIRYFAPTYFSPYFFPPLVSDGDRNEGAGVSSLRDRDAFSAILDALGGTGEFAAVLFGADPDRLKAGADLAPAAVVVPDAWAEIDDSDPVVVVRRVGFDVTIVVRGEDAFDRFDTLDRLSCVAQNALDGTDLGGLCLAPLSKTRWGRFGADASHPEQRVVLHGEFTYLIPRFHGHNTSR